MARFVSFVSVMWVICLSSVPAQTPEGVNLLLSKARSLETRGRMDLAVQNWQQVLLVSPDDRDALAGLARFARQTGNANEMRMYLERLRTINPLDPAIVEVPRMKVVTAAEQRLLDDAGRLAAQHKPDDALKIYRRVFGNDAPPGKWAEQYFEVVAATTGGRTKAIAGLRALSAKDPLNDVYRVWLARILTYDAGTRAEGLGLLESIRELGAIELARTIWRQALVWERENPSAQSSLETYLERYPDQELAQALGRLRELRESAARGVIQQRGFEALRRKDVATAQSRFDEVLRRAPGDVPSLVGLGFVRLDQKRFGDALGLFERARSLAPDDLGARDGYETARFWVVMERASALRERESASALDAYQEALRIRPRDPDAQLAVGQIMLDQGRLDEAQDRFDLLVKEAPANVDALAGLGFVRLGQQRFDDAAELLSRALERASARTDIDEGYRTARFWALMQRGRTAVRQQRFADAAGSYQAALAVRPGASEALFAVADVMERTRAYADAIATYSNLISTDSSQLRAWLGLMRAYLGARDAPAALAMPRRMPEAARRQLEARPEYQAQMVLALYLTNQLAAADAALQKTLDAARKSDTEDALNARMAVAGALVDLGLVDRAAQMFAQAAESHPKNADAWQGLIGAYARMGDAARALATVRAMPRDTFDEAATRTAFLHTVGVAYSAEGYCLDAERVLTRALDTERAAGRRPPLDTQLLLADIWSREGRYAKARESYRATIDADSTSIDGWRGYINALHGERNDWKVTEEAQRMPSATRVTLEQEPQFLVVLASAHANTGRSRLAVTLLQQARAREQARGRQPSADSDIQLAWTLVAANGTEEEISRLLTSVRSRKDLRETQRVAVEEISVTWRLRSADAVRRRDPERAVAILTKAASEQPGNPRIRSALVSLHVEQRQYERALKAYEAWGMKGASPGDYMSAVGAAMSAHDPDLAAYFLRVGLTQFRNDPDLLHLAATHAMADGQYAAAERYLKSALASLKRRGASPTAAGVGAAPRAPASVATPESVSGPGCRPSVAAAGTPFVLRVAASSNSSMTFAKATWAQETTPGGASNSGSAPSEEPAPAVFADRIRQLEDELEAVQHRNTPFVGGEWTLSDRTGDEIVSRLTVEDRAIAGSVTGNNAVRISAGVHMLHLMTRASNARSAAAFGTLAPGRPFAAHDTKGYALDVQLSTDNVGVALGIDPAEFPVRNVTGGIRIGSPDGPLVFEAARDHVRDSLISYAGVRDPGTGLIWGGILDHSVTLRASHDANGTGQYLSVSGALLKGTRVDDNWSVKASGGAYWRVAQHRGGALTIGVNGTGMHYDKNRGFYSLGHGGYFSPDRYYLVAVPVSWRARQGPVEYEISAGAGMQHIEQAQALQFPTGGLPSSFFYAATIQRATTYDTALRFTYRFTPHWHLGIDAAANNTRQFRAQSVMFTLRFLAQRLPSTTALRVRSIPDWRGRQPFGL